MAKDYVKEEILYREALALGLAEDDRVVRRRMRQKMEFMYADLVELERPTEAELQSYLEASPDKFQHQPRQSFAQLFINAGHDLEAAMERAAVLQTRLAGEAPKGANLQMLSVQRCYRPPWTRPPSSRSLAALGPSSPSKSAALRWASGWVPTDLLSAYIWSM